MTRRLLVVAIGVMFTLLALAALWQFRIVLVYVLISLLVAATFRPRAGRRLMRYRQTRGRLLLRYAVSIAAGVLLLFYGGKFLVNDFQQLLENMTEESTWLLPEWMEGSPIQQSMDRLLPAPSEMLHAFTRQRELMLTAAVGLTEGLGGALGGLVLVFFLSVYWSLNQNHFERLWLSLLPAEIRKRARYISRTIEYDLGAYTRSELIQSGLAMLLLSTGYWLIGSPYPVLLAFTGGLARLIPVIGPTLALVLPFLLGSLTSTTLGVFSLLYTALVLIVLHVWVEPRFFKINKDNPVLTFVILLAMTDAFGLLGMIAAPPLSLICQTLWRFLVTDRLATDSGSPVVDLRERYARLQAALQEIPGTPPPLVVSSMQRLTDLIEKAEPILDGRQREEPPSVLRAP